MSEYDDVWKTLTSPEVRQPATVEARDHALVTKHASTIPLSDQQRYQLAWGEGGGNGSLTSEWVKEHANAIRQSIDGSESTAVLRKGALSKAVTAAPKEAGAAASNGGSGAGETGRGDSGGSGDGGGNGGSSGGASSSGATGSLGGTHSGTNSLGSTGMGSTIGGVLGSIVGGMPGSMLGKAIGSLAESAMSSMGAKGVANYGVEGLDGTTSAATGPGTIGSRDSYGSNEGSPTGPGSDANTDASSSDAVNGHDSQSDAASGSGAGAGSGSGGGQGNAGGSGNDSGSGTNGASGSFNGGLITKAKLSGSNPAGPDDGFGALDLGEYVIRKVSVQKYGADIMAALNAGRLPVAEVRHLLNLQE